MLKFFKDDYADGREPIDMTLLENIFSETLKISTGVVLTDVEYKKALLLLFAGINYYFYLHPEQYIDFGKFVAYRSIDIKNLWTIEAKDGENANTIYDYFKNGGLEMEELKQLVLEYSSDILKSSSKRALELSNDIEELGDIVSQDND